MKDRMHGVNRAFWTCGMALLAAGAAVPQGALAQKPPETAKVAYSLISLDQYAGFISNWDEIKHPVRLVLVRDKADLTSVFHPAPVMGSRRPFTPDDSLFAKHDLLIVARVAGDYRSARCFRLKSVTRKEGVITVAYRFIDPAPSTDATRFKVTLALAIPKDAAREYRFVENDKSVGSLPELPDEGGYHP